MSWPFAVIRRARRMASQIVGTYVPSNWCATHWPHQSPVLPRLRDRGRGQEQSRESLLSRLGRLALTIVALGMAAEAEFLAHP